MVERESARLRIRTNSPQRLINLLQQVAVVFKNLPKSEIDLFTETRVLFEDALEFREGGLVSLRRESGDFEAFVW